MEIHKGKRMGDYCDKDKGGAKHPFSDPPKQDPDDGT